jgi:hypothetical protein
LIKILLRGTGHLSRRCLNGPSRAAFRASGHFERARGFEWLASWYCGFVVRRPLTGDAYIKKIRMTDANVARSLSSIVGELALAVPATVVELNATSSLQLERLRRCKA